MTTREFLIDPKFARRRGICAIRDGVRDEVKAAALVDAFMIATGMVSEAQIKEWRLADEIDRGSGKSAVKAELTKARDAIDAALAKAGA